ncbi:hypothetical protein OAH80_04695 [Acidimicrobiia bacterium]|nr:hypothetical protein [Acidimicrobiia bacterium]
MEDEQKEILDGVIIDISKFSSDKREELLSFSETIVEKFPGKQPLSFKWVDEDPFATEEALVIATCDDGFVDANNTKLYEYIYDLMHPFV